MLAFQVSGQNQFIGPVSTLLNWPSHAAPAPSQHMEGSSACGGGRCFSQWSMYPRCPAQGACTEWRNEWMNECMHESWHLGEWINTLMDKWNLPVALLFPLQCPVPGTVSSCFPTKTGSKRDVQGFCNLTVSKTSADGFRTSHSSRLPGSLCFKWSQSLGTRQASPPTHGGWRMEMLQREGAG